MFILVVCVCLRRSLLLLDGSSSVLALHACVSRVVCRVKSRGVFAGQCEEKGAEGGPPQPPWHCREVSDRGRAGQGRCAGATARGIIGTQRAL